ncbi:hypothetical protein BK704_01665 [[Bacillus thuringiensis] serovar konkukian]|uniref:hypothetical protein n=1 Tax=Bacillus cereus group TaxID=86661 RepID=UPI000B42FE3B|nr:MULTISPECIES: hypothetical protein [Bacillus cereus group]MED1305150.1 hypothetical protein [Bacillus pacificus]PCC77328.1 hypothetical protein CNQ76_23570 [Bacillus cereus]MCC2475747.1 hypothetical protein [Bacillus paranthracis]MDX5768547.1 hypothetical protein [Bacillus cereus group sp. BfR-BA-02675]MDX5891469.1 hypothetical protein [Bacillus cereus group sp. BfR-BA-01039]
MSKKKALISLTYAMALYSLVGCSNSTNAGTMAAEKEKAATSENKEVTNTEEDYELGEIKITNKERNKESRIEVVEAHIVDDGKQGLDPRNTALQEVIILHDKVQDCNYLYTYSSSSTGSGSATMKKLECGKKE